MKTLILDIPDSVDLNEHEFKMLVAKAMNGSSFDDRERVKRKGSIMKNIIFTLFCILLSINLFACNSIIEHNSEEEPLNSASDSVKKLALSGSKWELTSIKSKDGSEVFPGHENHVWEVPNDQHYSIEFADDNNILGCSYCNTCNGEYELEDNDSVLIKWACTREICGRSTEFNTLVGESSEIEKDEDTLQLFYHSDEYGDGILIFERKGESDEEPQLDDNDEPVSFEILGARSMNSVFVERCRLKSMSLNDQNESESVELIITDSEDFNRYITCEDAPEELDFDKNFVMAVLSSWQPQCVQVNEIDVYILDVDRLVYEVSIVDMDCQMPDRAQSIVMLSNKYLGYPIDFLVQKEQ